MSMVYIIDETWLRPLATSNKLIFVSPVSLKTLEIISRHILSFSWEKVYKVYTEHNPFHVHFHFKWLTKSNHLKTNQVQKFVLLNNVTLRYRHALYYNYVGSSSVYNTPNTRYHSRHSLKIHDVREDETLDY